MEREEIYERLEKILELLCSTAEKYNGEPEQLCRVSEQTVRVAGLMLGNKIRIY